MTRDLRLLPVVGGAWGVALACVFMPVAAGWVALASGVAVIAGAAILRRGSRSDGSPMALALVVLVVSAAVSITVLAALGFDVGARVSVIGEAAATDPGERAALVVFASSASVERPASGVFAVAAGLRAVFIDRAQRLPEPGAGLLPGLAVGDTHAVSQGLTEQIKASGLSHLTAVSGDIVFFRDGLQLHRSHHERTRSEFRAHRASRLLVSVRAASEPGRSQSSRFPRLGRSAVFIR